MPNINAALVPSINPGSLFDAFVENSSLNVRWLTATDPCYFEVLNRPLGDITLRQLIIAKALDVLNYEIGSVAVFPFIMQPQVVSGSTSVDLPVRLFWDMNISIPSTWHMLRLARIDRLDGTNSSTYTGTLRFIFTATTTGSELGETALFYADYEIDGTTIFQVARIVPATTATVSGFSVIDPSQSETIDGTIIFRTGDVTSTEIQSFYNLVAPGSSAEQYNIANSAAGNPSEGFDTDIIAHGLGMITPGAYNYITDLQADPETWIRAFNYPFDVAATMTNGTITIPSGLFTEFSILAPANDTSVDDTSGTSYPVWLSKITCDSTSSSEITLTFSTYSHASGSTPGTAVEFAQLVLNNQMVRYQIVQITPIRSLFTATDSSLNQDFGKGHVSLSSLWGTSTVTDFFADIAALIPTNSSLDLTFQLATTRLAALGINRTSKFSPTEGQSAALAGTSTSWAQKTIVYPSASNRYVTAADEGLGDQVDLGTESTGAISRYGYSATRCHKLIKLVIDPDRLPAASAGFENEFYTTEVLPRLTTLLGRAPKFGDIWFNGTKFVQYDEDSGAWIG